MKTAELGMAYDLWKALHAAGIVPEQCGDIVIEARVGQAVKVHYWVVLGGQIERVVAALVSAAKMIEREP